MSVSLSPLFNGYQSFLTTGLPNNGGFIYTYAAGSTTPQPTYTTNTGAIANANPIPLSADGRPPQEIWLTDGSAYKFVLTDALLNVLPSSTFDNIAGLSIGTLGGPTGASFMGTQQTGIGASVRTQLAKNNDIVSVSDYGTPAQAAAAILLLGTGTMTVPNMALPALPASLAGVVVDYQSQVNFNVYAEIETNRQAKRLLKSEYGTHSGTQQISLLGIEHRPFGSGFNGAANADMGMNVSVVKKNYLTSTVQGEIDGLNVVVRQGGPAGNGSNLNSDCAGILVDAGMLTGCGFLASYEGSSAIFNAAGATVRQIQTQIGVLDTTLNMYLGYVANVTAGNVDDGIRLLNTAPGSYTNYMRFLNTGATPVFGVDQFGRIRLQQANGTTPSKTIRVLNGNFSILNDAQSVEIFSIDDIGNLTASASIKGFTLTVSNPAQTVAAGQLSIGATTSQTVGAAGGAAAAPNPNGYLILNLGGTPIKVAYFNP